MISSLYFYTHYTRMYSETPQTTINLELERWYDNISRLDLKRNTISHRHPIAQYMLPLPLPPVGVL
jgi:hypothetical protein